jgi:hypothetical protein
MFKSKISLNEYERSIPDGSYVFCSYSGCYCLSTTRLRKGLLISLIIPSQDGIPFHIVSNPLDYGAASVVKSTGSDFSYVVQVFDRFGDAASISSCLQDLSMTMLRWRFSVSYQVMVISHLHFYICRTILINRLYQWLVDLFLELCLIIRLFLLSSSVSFTCR